MPRHVLPGLLLVSLLAGACASGRAVPRPFPGAAPPGSGPAGPAATAPAPPSPGAPSAPAVPAAAGPIVDTALMLRGVPYRDGGHDPSGFDCSGFVQYVFARHGRALPRDVRSQYQHGRSIDPGELRPGDLVFFQTVSRGASHVGIVVEGSTFVHAPSSRGVVRVEQMTSSYWARRYVGARRLE